MSVPKRTAKKMNLLIRSDEVSLTEQIFGQIVRSHPARRTGAKMGSIFAPGFHSAGDGMKATIVISPLRRVLETFFGLNSSRGENGQKRRPFKLNYGLPLSEQAVLFILPSVEALYYAKIHSGRLWSAQNMAGGRSEPQRK